MDGEVPGIATGFSRDDPFPPQDQRSGTSMVPPSRRKIARELSEAVRTGLEAAGVTVALVG
ncbi:MAG: hypothetical protein PF508_01120, partial [Spirochaeta sp.]|nr:hypothetical protein [Spirochaeta sp.]